MNKRTTLALVGIVGVSALTIPTTAAFAGNGNHGNDGQKVHKSYVCKYVSKPGEAERLQTGQNPIFVDNHALLGGPGDVYVGQEFKDGQFRSVVIVANTPKLNPEPGVDQCPPVTPPPSPSPSPSNTPSESPSPSPSNTPSESPSPSPSPKPPVVNPPVTPPKEPETPKSPDTPKEKTVVPDLNEVDLSETA